LALDVIQEAWANNDRMYSFFAPEQIDSHS
jgi:hypothetical protein